MSTARQEILNRIRNAIGRRDIDPQQDYEALCRDYVQASTLGLNASLDLFVDRLHDYGADVYRCAEGRIADAVRDAMTKRGKSELLIPPELPPAWLPVGYRFVPDKQLEYREIDASQGVLTGCAAAIALTGTIVLRHSAGEGRRALTLIPDYHLCVVFANQVVETVPQGVREMEPFSTVPLTTISGPSATSDIEMTRIKGVHGPRTLDVILVE
jgi:L-lactate dehydrogenase complex protein LldG